MAASAANARRLLSVEFEVFGKVQGVFFRKHTKKKSKELGIVGWVKNTPHLTVVGQLQGEEKQIVSMKEWLSTTGSPHSKIEKCQFSNEQIISKLEFDGFEIVR